MDRSALAAITLGILASALLASKAFAHGVAGKRFFPATLATDDPFVADELSLPTVSTTGRDKDFSLESKR